MKNSTFATYSEDKEDFELKIEPEIEEGKQLNIFCSFTYITPNYSILFTLEELKKFTQNGKYRVLLVLWDMNTLSNAYFRRLRALKKITNAEVFINQKVEELRTIAYSLGFDKENLLIYKSSDLWKRLISYKEDDLFQQFYSVLAQMKIKEYHIPSDKISHLIQIPMDVFFCNYLHKLYPEDLDREVDLAYFGRNKESLYPITRDLMLKNGLIEKKNPIFIMMRDFPYLIYNDSVPEWNMSQRDIKEIVIGSELDKKDLLSMFRHLEENFGYIGIKADKNIDKISYNEFVNQFEDASVEDLSRILAENLYNYLQVRKEQYQKSSGDIEEKILNISKKEDVRKISSALKSKIAFEILTRADGTRNTTKIAKELSKSVATISTYVNRLKKMGLIRVLSDGNLRRTIKGIKINIELGV
jgi:predicted transcriptional regulator